MLSCVLLLVGLWSAGMAHAGVTYRFGGGAIAGCSLSGDGGRYRTGPDLDLPGAAYINDAEPGNAFDVLTQLNTIPAQNDVIVIDNRAPEDVYGKTNTATVRTVSAPPNPALGTGRIELNGDMQVHQGYDGARFVVVPAMRQIVT